MKLTEWFPGDVKPVRRGVYERDFGDGTHLTFSGFSRWTGSRWAWRGATPDEAASEKAMSINYGLRWRGLAEKP
jgi:hypothetical protein